MEIVIEWRDGLIEVVSASEAEAGLGPAARTAVVMARARLDLFEEEGLRVDFWGYSAFRDRSTPSTRMGPGDIGEGMNIPNLNLEPGRVLRLLDADQLGDVVSITVDRRWRIRRYGDALVNETRLDAQTLYWLGAEGMGLPIVQRVTLLDERIRHAHRDWEDEDIAELCGFPFEAWERIMSDEASGAGGRR